MRRRDWTLLALASAGGETLTPVQVQKSLFLLGENFSSGVGPRFYRFQPYHYGPFDRAVYEDAEELASEGLARVDREPSRLWVEYAATERGLERAGSLKANAPHDAVLYLDAVVAWARKLNFQQLVSSIYKMYPAQKVNSVFRE